MRCRPEADAPASTADGRLKMMGELKVLWRRINVLKDDLEDLWGHHIRLQGENRLQAKTLQQQEKKLQQQEKMLQQQELELQQQEKKLQQQELKLQDGRMQLMKQGLEQQQQQLQLQQQQEKVENILQLQQMMVQQLGWQ